MADSPYVGNVSKILRAWNKQKVIDGYSVAQGVEISCNIILKQSNIWCPVDTRALQSTGAVHMTGSGYGARGEITYGGPGIADDGSVVDVFYAVRVHEDPEMRHDPPTRYHFLTDAMVAKKKACEKVMQRSLLEVPQETQTYLDGVPKK